jgi:hypothetical protein
MQALNVEVERERGEHGGVDDEQAGRLAGVREWESSFLCSPGDMEGVRVLELYAGASRSSFRHVVEEGEGVYYSVDKDPKCDHEAPRHLVADVSDLGVIFGGYRRFGAVVMRRPPWWGGVKDFDHEPRSDPGDHGFESLGRVVGVVGDAASLLKRQPGTFVGIGGGCSLADVAALSQGLEERGMKIGEEWEVETQLESDGGKELYYRDQGGGLNSPVVPTYAVRIVRKSGG